MSTREVMVVSGARTAIGDYGGSLKDLPPTKLGAIAIKEAVARSRLDPASDRPRGDRQRDPRRGARHVHLARRRDRRGAAGGHALPDGEPPVRLRPAGDRLGRAAHPAGRRGHRAGRRRGEHEPRGLLPARRALGPAHGRRRGGGRHDRRAARPLRPRPHGHHRGEHRRQVRLHARGAGRFRAGIAPARGERARERLLQGADRPDRNQDPARASETVHYRRARAQGREDRGHAEAEGGVQEGRHGHRGQCLRAERCRRGDRHVQCRIRRRSRISSRWRGWSPTRTPAWIRTSWAWGRSRR